LSSEKSQADLLREHISLQLDRNFDYSLASNCSADIKSFCDANRDRKYSEKNVRPAHSKILHQVLKNRGIDPKSLGKKTRKLKFNTELNANITPSPVAGTVDSKKPTGEKPKVLLDKDGKPIQTVGAPPPHQYEHFDVDGVGATFQAFIMMFRVALPEMEGLSDEEKKTLGRMWLPAFQRYLTENWAYIGVPFLATMGMLLPKLVTARRKHKENEENKKRNLLTEKANAEEKERHEQKKAVCPYCRKEFSEMQLQEHKPKCTEKPKYGV